MAVFINTRARVIGPIFGKYIGARGAANRRDRLFVSEEQAASDNVQAHVAAGDLVRLDVEEPSDAPAPPAAQEKPEAVTPPVSGGAEGDVDDPAVTGGSEPADASIVGDPDEGAADTTEGGKTAIEDLKVSVIRDQLKSLGLSTSGSKAELVARLQAAVSEEAS